MRGMPPARIPVTTEIAPGWTYEGVAKWVCGKDVEVVAYGNPHDMNAAFGVKDAKPTIRIYRAVLQLPKDIQFIVLLHESWHCHQWADDIDRSGWTHVEVEQDADVHAADIACMLGLDGLRLDEESYPAMGIPIGAPDKDHGSPRERIANVRARAMNCRHDLQAS